MIAFYNEIDDYCCAWLSNLMDAGLITPGIISNESIEDLTPAELIGYDRVHLFAGIGVWDYALRLAGWPSNRSVWTLSCPCQPFSSAGKGAGFADERHLWPAAYHLIGECKPVELLGEQVASKDASAWIDVVHADLEALGYAFGCVPFPSAGVGAPHIRDRAYWVADSGQLPEGRTARSGEAESGRACGNATGRGDALGVGDPVDSGLQERKRLARNSDEPLGGVVQPNSARCKPGQSTVSPARHGNSFESASSVHRPLLSARELAGIPYSGKFVDPDVPQPLAVRASSGKQSVRDERDLTIRETDRPGPTNGYWRNADWLGCRDDKWRPVESAYVQMVDGASRSLGSLRADTIEKIEKEINDWAIRYKTELGKALHDVRGALEPEAQQVGEAGRLSSVLEAPVLLAFLRQFETQRRSISQSVSRTSAEKEETVLRVLRYDHTVTGASHRRGLDEQYRQESANPLHLLSSILAQNALEAWGEDAFRNACDTSTLAEAAPARMQRLRGYGNAINAQAAKTFIESYLEC